MLFKIIKFFFIVSASSFSNNIGICRRKLISSTAFLTTTSLPNPVNTNEDPNKEVAANKEAAENKEAILEPFTLHFYGAVTDESCFQLTSALIEIDKKAKQQKLMFPYINPHISLHIQSGGGALMPTFFVCDVIKNLDTPVFVYVDGYAASAASLMVVSGKNRYMTKNSAMLIHQLTGATSGKFNEIKDEVTNLNFFMNKVKNIYIENTKLNSTTLDELLESDIWLDAETCLAYGLVDKIL
tara:strand:- start:14 stop:736 length:723 start_codon:yes stop_codon:yes gene_type:complete